MNIRERVQQERTPQPSDAGGSDGDNLERLRQTANEFLAAGDEAIRRALSGDSEAFLRANRQPRHKVPLFIYESRTFPQSSQNLPRLFPLPQRRVETRS